MPPSTKASSTIEPSTCRLLAPSVRSMPSSRMRWATVIENVLKIRNEPTSSAMKPMISSRTFRKESDLAVSLDCRCGRLLRGLNLHGYRHDLADARRQGGGVDALGGGYGDLVELPALVGQPLGLGQRELGDSGAPERRVAELGEPDDWEAS